MKKIKIKSRREKRIYKETEEETRDIRCPNIGNTYSAKAAQY